LNETATQEDIARIIQSIRIRDERIVAAEAELRRLTEDYRRLREELLPVFKMAKDRSQPLPYQPGSEFHNHENQPVISPSNQHEKPEKPEKPEKSGSSLSRTFSKKLFSGGSTPKNHSPTHIPPAIHEGKVYDSNLDPSSAASSHLTANGGSSPKNGNLPSPTSPGHFPQTLSSRAYNRDHSEDTSTRQDRSNPTSSSQSSRLDPPNSASRTESSRGGESGGAPSVEIFKSFRVSMDDPCYKVLPAALKKYNINADWRQYALYIVYGDQERCLGLDERPLILFKQLEKEGRKPMFMLRKQAQPIDQAYAGGSAPNSAGFNQGLNSQIQLPGGVL